MAPAIVQTPPKQRTKKRRVRSAVSWLLRWRILALPALLVVGMSIESGFSAQNDAVAAHGVLLGLFIPAALVIFLLPLQRVVFAMRFESGPKLLDLPRKSHAFVTAALICAPLLIFQTLLNYNYVSRHAERDAAMADALNDIAIVSADRYVNERRTLDTSLTGEARDAEIQAWASHIVESEAARMIADRQRVANARRRLSMLVDPDDTTSEHALFLRALDARGEAMGYGATPSVHDYGSFVSVSMDRNSYLDGLDLCGSLDRLRQTAASAVALRPWAAPAQAEGQGHECQSDGPSQNTIAVAFTGFVGLLSFFGFALASAIILRTARLSQSSGIVAGVGLALLFPLFFALLDFAKVTLTGRGDDIPVFYAFVEPATIYALLGSSGLAAMAGMRKDGWAGHFARLGLISLPLVLVLALVLTARLMVAFGAPQAALHQLALAAPFVFAAIAWLGWEILDRVMLRLNCAPIRATAARRQLTASEPRTLNFAERARAVGPLISAAVAITLTGRPPVERQRHARAKPQSSIELTALSNWLLRRRAATAIAIALCIAAIAAGLYAGAFWTVDLAPAFISWATIFSGVALAFIAQRPLSAMRFESGPRHLDLPNKFATFAIVTALIAPPFLLQSAATAMAIQKAPQDEQVYRSVTAVIEASAAFRRYDLNYLNYSADEMRDPAAMRARFERARAEALAQFAPARTILAARIEHAQQAVRADPEAVQQLADHLKDVDDRIATLRAGVPAPEEGQNYQVLMSFQDLCLYSDRAGVCERYNDSREHLSIRAAFAPWAIPNQLPLAENSYGDALPGARSGFIGLLGLIALGFVAATTLRVCRLSEMPALYIFAGLVSALATVQALVELAARAVSINSALYSFMCLGLGALILAAAGFIGQLRREAWGGYFIRLVAIFFPALLTFLLATQAFVVPPTLIAIAPLAMLIVGWIVWDVLDRWIVRANCRPNRVARGEAV